MITTAAAITLILYALLAVVGCVAWLLGKARSLHSRLLYVELAVEHLAGPDPNSGALLSRARATPVTSIEPSTCVYTLQCPHCHYEHTCKLSHHQLVELRTEKDPS